MGTAASPNVFPQFSQLINTAPTLKQGVRGRIPNANAALPALVAAAGKGAPARAPRMSEADIEGNYDALTYRTRMERVSLAAEFQKVRERIAEAYQETGATETGGRMEQLLFSFFAESRYEELAVFQQRAAKIAEGLDGAQQQAFVQAARGISVRFSMSLTITGAALHGFTGGAEALQNGEPASFGQFLGFAQDALNQLDEIANEVFSLMHDLVQGGGELRERLQKFIGELEALGLFGNGEAPALPEGMAGTSQTQFQAQNSVIQMEFEFEYTEITPFREQIVQEADPIVVDLDGDGIELTSHHNGARFDITGTGNTVTTAFVTGADAFLAIDRNGNGRIDNGTELFGDQNGAANGFEELRKLDSNGDGRINRLDDNFEILRLWRDDGDGNTEDGELITLAQGGVEEIALGYRNVNQVAAGGNRIEQIASFLRNDGSRGTAADAILNFTA